MAAPMSLDEIRAMLNKMSKEMDLMRRRIDIIVADLDYSDAIKKSRKATKRKKKQ